MPDGLGPAVVPDEAEPESTASFYVVGRLLPMFLRPSECRSSVVPGGRAWDPS
jgi:hypothetical protein